VEPAEIVALDLLVVVDNESDTLPTVDEGVPQRPELGRASTKGSRRRSSICSRTGPSSVAS
jgi:hypothetical protein